jgi:2-polyprenyl-3-methyl-5-hydroxy-6-metoxy-1,4-benzoquinol methylase
MFNIQNFIEEIYCPNCNKNSYEVIKNSNYLKVNSLEDLKNIYRSSADELLIDQLVKCINCNLQYLNPRINSKIIIESYEENIDEAHISQDVLRIETFTKSLKKIIKIFDIKNLEEKFFLDIGSASGACLRSIKNFGFKEEGYEPSKWMVEYGKKKYDVNINQGSIANVDENKRFDLISFWDVLEHVTELDETLKKVKKISKDNGFIIINVPNIKSLACTIMGNRWPFYLNVHLYYFSKDTIKTLLKKYNFDLVDHFPHWQYLELGYLCKRAKKYMKIFNYVEKLILFLRLSNISVPYNIGQTTFIFKNNKNE